MNYIETYKIYKKYFNGIVDKKRNLHSIKEIVIHGTGGGRSAESLINWMENGERKIEYLKGIALFHDLVDYNGNIYNLVPYNYYTLHSSSGIKHDRYTIGIELMNREKQNNGEYTKEQYMFLWELLFNKIILLCPNIKKIVSHNYNKKKYSNKNKNCPGNFRWDFLEEALLTWDFKFKKISKLGAYEIAID
jgi:N-acetyl-anhydromuramyl-L-alanine amidase AmpD